MPAGVVPLTPAVAQVLSPPAEAVVPGQLSLQSTGTAGVPLPTAPAASLVAPPVDVDHFAGSTQPPDVRSSLRHQRAGPARTTRRGVGSGGERARALAARRAKPAGRLHGGLLQRLLHGRPHRRLRRHGPPLRHLSTFMRFPQVRPLPVPPTTWTPVSGGTMGDHSSDIPPRTVPPPPPLVPY